MVDGNPSNSVVARTAAFNRGQVRVWDFEPDGTCTGCGTTTAEGYWSIYFGKGKDGHGKKEVALCPDCMMDLAIQVPLKT